MLFGLRSVEVLAAFLCCYNRLFGRFYAALDKWCQWKNSVIG
jgi:hypothetical protein